MPKIYTKGGTQGNLSSSNRVIFDGNGVLDWKNRYNAVFQRGEIVKCAPRFRDRQTNTQRGGFVHIMCTSPNLKNLAIETSLV